MSDKYDTILKEKKVYEDYVPTHAIFKKFMLFGIFLGIIVIIVSYVIYYNTFLSGETILLNNVIKLLDNYSIVFKGVNNNYKFNNSYMIEGNVVSDKFSYNYNFIRDNNTIKRTFSNDNKKFSFYYDGDSNYIKLSDLDKYISIDNSLFSLDDYKKDYDILSDNVYKYFYYVLFDENIIDIYDRLYMLDNYNNILANIRNNFLDYVSDNNYVKKFYFYNGRPVVKIDLSLNSKAINKILGNGNNNLSLKDDYEVIITTRNDAIMNDIKNIKIVINNKTKKNRVVLSYDGNDLLYTNNEGVAYRYNLEYKNDKFNLKIYNGDVLYSALEGYKDNDKYIYNYQYIDKLERYSLEILYKNEEYNYKFISNVNNVVNNIIVNGKYSDVGAIDVEDINVINYRELDDKARDIINDKIVNYLK